MLSMTERWEQFVRDHLAGATHPSNAEALAAMRFAFFTGALEMNSLLLEHVQQGTLKGVQTMNALLAECRAGREGRQ